MSRQLAVSSAFSIFALAALALLTPRPAETGAGNETGAAIEIATPAAPEWPALLTLTD